MTVQSLGVARDGGFLRRTPQPGCNLTCRLGMCVCLCVCDVVLALNKSMDNLKNAVLFQYCSENMWSKSIQYLYNSLSVELALFSPSMASQC